MPIKVQPSSPIELLTNYTPFSTSGEQLVENIDEMVSYTVIEPETPVNLQFTFGATNPLVATFAFKNLTNNADIEITLVYDTNVFNSLNNSVVIGPGDVARIPLNLRIDNMEVGVVNKALDITVLVRNVSNGSLVYLADTAKLPIETLNQTINIYE
jgi:hypothetical protein